MWKFNSSSFFCKITLTVQGRRTVEGKFDWENACADAAILSGITLCSGIAALAGSQALTLNSFCILACTVGGEFLGFLAVKRGLIPQNQKQNST